MKRKCVFLVVAVLTCFQLHAQKQAIIEGHIEGLPDGTKVWILSNERTWKDSTFAKDGRFSFHLNIPGPRSYNLRLSREFEKGKWQDFYVDAGGLQIESVNGNFSEMRLSGSRFATEQNRYFTMVNSDSNYAYLVKNVRSAEDAKKRNALKAILAAKWIRENVSSVINGYLLTTDIKGNADTALLRALLNSLPPASRKDIFAQSLQQDLDTQQKMAIGNMAPEFTQADTAGRPVALKQFRGGYLLIDFWASWCVPCREENPNLKKAYERLKSRGLKVLGVSLDSDKKNWIQAIRQDGLQWTHVSDLKLWDNRVVKLYGVKSVPANFLIDPQGKIIAKNLRGADLEMQLGNLMK
ncbi:MAG: AhpC/TSA family protein [Chitinophagaceae bacterium]|nr:AhpC/TSA family protein [Chitinophagaceae bacterium]